MRTPNLSGRKFGRLTVQERTTKPGNTHSAFWLCVCECGNKKVVATSNLLCGTVKSCGCLRKEQSVERFKRAAANNVTHGESGTHLYDVWHNMRQRCENPNSGVYRWYGAKGVKVCDEWHDFEGFSKWAHANGYKDLDGVPRRERLSIDRIDSSGDYCPSNCRWITVSENTTRGTKARWENATSGKRSGRADCTV